MERESIQVEVTADEAVFLVEVSKLESHEKARVRRLMRGIIDGTDSLTKEAAFHKAPAFPEGLMQVNAGVENTHALMAAEILSGYVRERLNDMVNGDEGRDEPWVLSLLTDMSGALYRASGVEA